MESSSSTPQILEAMEAALPKEAASALDRLTAQLRSHGPGEVSLAKMWSSFKRLLHRRGYFVGTPAELATSLKEIAAVGEGFDLYDLARGLAEYDETQMDCLGRTGHRALPELAGFSPFDFPPGAAKED